VGAKRIEREGIMATIRVTERDGSKHTLDAPPGIPLMHVLRDAGLSVDGTCGGVASCGTCHIYVNEDWRPRLPARGEAELDMLQALGAFDESASRLACQIPLTPELDGLEITVAPGEY
jgi:2Fe-2S ferredoxin